MNKIEQIRADMITAMKEKDKDKKLALSFLLGQIKNAEIEKRTELTDDEVNQVVMKEIKQIKESIESTPIEREDLMTAYLNRLVVLEKYQPRLMDKSEIRRTIFTVLEELHIESPMKSDKGNILKVLMPKVRGKADNKLVVIVLDYFLDKGVNHENK